MVAKFGGFGNLDEINRVQLKFLKHILKMKNSTPNVMVYGETGIMPISIDIQTRVISYWSKLITSSDRKLSTDIYTLLLYNFNNTNVRATTFKWLKNIKNILYSCGMQNVWSTHFFPNSKWITCSVHQKLKDIFLNEWYETVENSSSCKIYSC
jgi:hypothetical protein